MDLSRLQLQRCRERSLDGKRQYEYACAFHLSFFFLCRVLRNAEKRRTQFQTNLIEERGPCHLFLCVTAQPVGLPRMEMTSGAT